MCDLTASQFQDKGIAREHLESIRWPDGAVCPHCGGVEKIYPIKGKAARAGLYKCGDCRKQFTVTVGTVFERSKIPLNKWLMAVHLMCASKKGISAHQLHRMLGITYKSAWFMCHRVREAMRDDSSSLLGGGGSTVEVDETFIGHDTSKKAYNQKKGRGYHHKEKVFTLVERNGRARSFHVNAVNAGTLRPILKEQVDADTHIMTDEAGQYCQTRTTIESEFASHNYVKHGIGEYVRGDIHTNMIEGYFSIFKRGMKGVFQHCSKTHLKRYLCEFDFRDNNRSSLGISDSERAILALQGIEGKRMMYRD